MAGYRRAQEKPQFVAHECDSMLSESEACVGALDEMC